MSENQISEEIECPYILFRVNNGLYCVNSRDVSTIMELPDYENLPEAPPYITGVFSHRDMMVTMFDLRSAMKQPTLLQEYDDFTSMLDARKQDHIDWVNTLEKCIESRTPFSLAVDPHKCVLGKWYDNFESDSHEVKHYMAQMEEPHEKLHRAAIRVQACLQPENGEQRECVNEILREIREDYVPKILNTLEGAKEIFHNRIYHEMVLVLSGKTQLGIVVDEVVSVEKLECSRSREEFDQWKHSPYVSCIMRSENLKELILEVDVANIRQAVELGKKGLML